ncbi:MAG: ATP-grasp domain-containing protein [Planctomycetota bacterium]|nr:ATP-grasp domain-containing protein [Planctomycetota bacterium]
MSEKVRVNVFYGGFSSERSVSLETGRNVGNALKKLGYPVKFVDVNRDFPDSPYGLDCDVAFIALHGEFGEDGGIQDVLESADVPFTGSSAAASRLALNKVQAQRLFSFNGIPVPPSHSARGREEVMALVRKVQGYPVIVKPAREGSTYGISVVRRCEQLRSALERALEFDELVLVEKFIEGREFTVGLVGSRALPVLES